MLCDITLYEQTFSVFAHIALIYVDSESRPMEFAWCEKRPQRKINKIAKRLKQVLFCIVHFFSLVLRSVCSGEKVLAVRLELMNNGNA